MPKSISKSKVTERVVKADYVSVNGLKMYYEIHGEGSQSNSADRSTNIDTFMIAFVFVLWFTIVSVAYSFLQIRDGKRRKMNND